MGYSRDSFYRFKELYETGSAAALQKISRHVATVFMIGLAGAGVSRVGYPGGSDTVRWIV